MARVGDERSTVEPVNNYGLYRQPRITQQSSERRRRGDAAPEGRYDGRTHATRLPAAGLARTPVKDSVIARLQEQVGRLTAKSNELLHHKIYVDAEQRIAGLAEGRRLEHQAEALRRQIEHTAKTESESAITTAAVTDPWGRGERILATIDRRVDILEMERSHKRISEAAYQTGRQVQAVLERQGKIKSTDWGGASRGDPAETRLLNTIRTVCSAKEILALQERIRGRIGIYDMRLLRRVIGDRMSFAECAAQEGKGGDRGSWYMANRFRDALEDLAEVFASVGKGRPTPEDDYKEMAQDVGPRQAAAIAGGVTLQRYRAEAEGLRAAAAASRSARERVKLTAKAEDLEARVARMGGAE